MWFEHFWHRSKPDERHDEEGGFRDWRDSGVADEVEAFLTGRLVDRIAASGRAVPAWAVLNRLAHADRPELVRLVEGGDLDGTSPASPWLATERFVAGHLLAKASSPDELARVQQATLIPVELGLIERAKVVRLTAEQVLEAGAEAVDTFHPGR